MNPPKEHDMDQSDLRARVVELERWRVLKEIDSARHDERWKRMDDKIEAVSAKIDEVSGTLRWIGKMIIGAIILAIVAFMIAGGFHVGG